MGNRLFQFLYRFSILLILSGSCFAEDRVEPDRLKIGLVLSGGGARGAAHAGVIKVLHELQIPIDYIAGVSMGAVIGGLYAAGVGPDELVELTRSSDWIDFYTDRPPRASRSFRRKSDGDNFLIDFDVGLGNDGLRFPQGIIQGQKFELALRRWLGPVASISEFDRLPIPFRAIATDIANGDMVVLDSGDLPSAIRASISVPGVFIPVEIDGRVLVDGGIANNLPIDIVREMGADILIVVNVGFPLLSADELDSAFRLTSQMITVLIKARTEDQLKTMTSNDLLIEPLLGKLDSVDFTRVSEAIDIGESAGRSMSSELASLSIPRQEYIALQAERLERRKPLPIVRQTIVKNNSRLSSKVLETRVANQEGETLNISQLESDISNIYALDIFESTSYRLIPQDDEVDLVISSKGKSWGPNYLRFGVNLESDFAGTNNYNIATRLTATEINPLGGEVRLEAQMGTDSRINAEWFQPVDYGSQWFVSSSLTLGRSNMVEFQNSNQVAEFLSGEFAFSAGIGREFGNNSEARLSYVRVHNESEILIGSPFDDTNNSKLSALAFSYTYDTLDNLDVPLVGTRFVFDWVDARDSLGSDVSVDMASVSIVKPITWGRNTVLNWWELASVAEGDVAPFFLGGLFSLSGYKAEELNGAHAGIMRMLYYRNLSDAKIPLLHTPVYLGGSIEVGNVWDDWDDVSFGDTLTAGSVFILVETFLGPVYFAYGAAEGGRNSFYLFLGQTF